MGPDGYFEFIKNILSNKRREREEALRWCGGAYDPDDIGASDIAAALSRIGSRDESC